MLFCRLVRISLKTVFGLCAKLLHSDAPSVLMSLFESFLCICFDTYNNAKLTSFSSWFKTTTLLLNLSPSSSFLLEQNCSAPCFAPKAKLLSSPLSQSGTGLFSTQDLMPHFCPSWVWWPMYSTSRTQQWNEVRREKYGTA